MTHWRLLPKRGEWACDLCGVTVESKQAKALHDMDVHPEDAECLKRFGNFPLPADIQKGQNS